MNIFFGKFFRIIIFQVLKYHRKENKRGKNLGIYFCLGYIISVIYYLDTFSLTVDVGTVPLFSADSSTKGGILIFRFFSLPFENFLLEVQSLESTLARLRGIYSCAYSNSFSRPPKMLSFPDDSFLDTDPTLDLAVQLDSFEFFLESFRPKNFTRCNGKLIFLFLDFLSLQSVSALSLPMLATLANFRFVRLESDDQDGRLLIRGGRKIDGFRRSSSTSTLLTVSGLCPFGMG